MHPYLQAEPDAQPSDLTLQELLDRLALALRKVAAEQPELWAFKAGERAIHAQVFHELRAMAWPLGLSVDSEWRRAGDAGDLKQLPSRRKGAQPDVVVHRRGKDGVANNLLVVEFKLEHTRAEEDRAKVKELMKTYSYRVGVVVTLGDGTTPDIAASWCVADSDTETTARLRCTGEHWVVTTEPAE